MQPTENFIETRKRLMSYKDHGLSNCELMLWGKSFGRYWANTLDIDTMHQKIICKFQNFGASDYFRYRFKFYHADPCVLVINFTTGKMTASDKEDKVIFCDYLEIN